MALRFIHAGLKGSELWLRKVRSSRPARSPVTIHIAPPAHQGSFYRRQTTQGDPDPCARETVLRALLQCNKGQKKFNGPLWFEDPEPRRQQSPVSRPSAFQPVPSKGVVRPFVPRPGQLNGSLRSRVAPSASQDGPAGQLSSPLSACCPTCSRGSAAWYPAPEPRLESREQVRHSLGAPRP